LLTIVTLIFMSTSTNFQKSDNILTLIPLTMSGLRHQKEIPIFSLMSLIPMTFNSNTISCYNGSYFATIAVFFSGQRPLNLSRPSMPSSPSSLGLELPQSSTSSHFVLMPPTTLSISTSSSSSITTISWWSHDTSMGHARLVCTHTFCFPRILCTNLLSPLPLTTGSWRSSLSSFLTFYSISSPKETMIHFGYTYAPTLTHQGACVITRKWLTTNTNNGWRNM